MSVSRVKQHLEIPDKYGAKKGPNELGFCRKLSQGPRSDTWFISHGVINMVFQTMFQTQHTKMNEYF